MSLYCIHIKFSTANNHYKRDVSPRAVGGTLGEKLPSLIDIADTTSW